MNIFKISPYGKSMDVYIEASRYMDTGALAVGLFNTEGELYAELTCNAPESRNLHINESFVEVHEQSWVCKFLEHQGIAKPSGKTAVRFGSPNIELMSYLFDLTQIPMIGHQSWEWISIEKAKPPEGMIVMGMNKDTFKVYENTAILEGWGFSLPMICRDLDVRHWVSPFFPVTHWRPYTHRTCAQWERCI